METSETLTEELRQARRDYVTALNKAWHDYLTMIAPDKKIWEEKKKLAHNYYLSARTKVYDEWIQRQTQIFLRHEEESND